MTYIKYNESVKTGKKWASQYFESIGKSHKYRKYFFFCFFLFFYGYACLLQAYKIHWQHTLTLELKV